MPRSATVTCPYGKKARAGRLCNWASCPKGCLAYLIVTDQFPRNMFRDDPRAFATDEMARKVAARACHLRFDGQIEEPARQFFYLPLMHSESQMDQDRAVRMFLLRMPNTGAQNLLHARAHRAVIREFGRFPYRNNAFGAPDDIGGTILPDRRRLWAGCAPLAESRLSASHAPPSWRGFGVCVATLRKLV